MILVYNETETPMWDISEKGTNYFKLMNKQDPSFSIGIQKKDFTHDDLDKESLKSVNAMNTLSTAFKKNTAVRFDRWQLRPFVKVSNNSFNSDVIFATFDISDGRRLINIRNFNSYIYKFHYDYEKKQLFVVFSLNTTVKRACLEVLCEENIEDNPKIYLKVFHLSYDGKTLAVTSRTKKKNDIVPIGEPGYIHYSDYSVDRYKYNARTYLPIHMTHCVVDPYRKKEEILTQEFLKSIKIRPSDILLIQAPEKEENGTLRNAIKDVVESKRITAVTYLLPDVKHEDLKGNQEAYKELQKKVLKDFYGDYFEHIFALDGNNTIFIIK